MRQPGFRGGGGYASPELVLPGEGTLTKAKRATPWREVVRLKEELKTGELSLAQFAADLHEVAQGAGKRPVYENPAKFFALTFPTHALRELVKDVAHRLDGQSDKAVRQLELTYGGGKTHTLITLHHLFRDPASLPDLAAVREFREAVGRELPRAFVASLCFDKIDVERGIEDVRGPGNERRTLRHPWSVLAFQLAGDDGLRDLHGEEKAEERETPPAEPLLAKLIARPQREGNATLILVDEVLMYARQKAGMSATWRSRIQDFFQYLVQAVSRVDRAALVASLLATDPAKQSDAEGKLLMGDLSNVFRRQKEEGVQPVAKEDVAEVLRRRFFVPKDLANPDSYRHHVIAAVRDLGRLDEHTRKNAKAEEERFHASYPFHPDLTETFYSRWTQLDGFQRTRGILRTLAIGLREAAAWDPCPVIGPAVLLGAPGAESASAALSELAGVATTEQVEGKRTEWKQLLERELALALQAQDELSALAPKREVEQAVVAVFLNSQPLGHKAHTPELVRLVGTGSPDGIELDKGLQRWRDLSWFLDDEDTGGTRPDGRRELPKSWRLGNRPNLRQMHDEAVRQRVSADAVEERLVAAIRKAKSLTEGATAAGAQVHLLPQQPADLPDDSRFRFAVLGPDAASESGKPSAAARRFLDETTGADRPRVHRNTVVLASSFAGRAGRGANRRAEPARLGGGPGATQRGRTRRGPDAAAAAESEAPGRRRPASGGRAAGVRDRGHHGHREPGAGVPAERRRRAALRPDQAGRAVAHPGDRGGTGGAAPGRAVRTLEGRRAVAAGGGTGGLVRPLPAAAQAAEARSRAGHGAARRRGRTVRRPRGASRRDGADLLARAGGPGIGSGSRTRGDPAGEGGPRQPGSGDARPRKALPAGTLVR